MYSIRPKWRLVPLLGAIAAMAVAVTVLFGGNPLESQRAAAGGGPPFNVSGINCSDVYLAELEQPIANAKPAGTAPGDPPPTTVLLRIAMAMSRTFHDSSSSTAVSVDPIQSVIQTYNLAIPGVIAGVLRLSDFPLCAKYDDTKIVAQVTSNPATPTDPQTISVTDTGGNPTAVGMIVFWNSANAAQRGFWYVSAAGGGSATLQKTSATCNQAPTSGFHAAPGFLHSCIAENKGFNPYIFLPTDVSSKPALCCVPNLANRPTQGTYNQGTNTTVTTICAVSTGKVEGAAQGAWTRTTITTVPSTDLSKKTPSYTTTQLFNPTNVKTCTDIAGQTKRSTLISVSWPLNSNLTGDGLDPNLWMSDYDKDGCTNAQELNSPVPDLIGSAGSFTGGRDPLNPNDCDRSFDSIVSLNVEAIPVTLDINNNNRVPGAFFNCRADLQDAANALTARVFCYVDREGIAVNTAHSGVSSCPPGPASDCGDGLTGGSYPVGTAPPPGPHGDVDAAHVVLTGSYDKQTDLITLQGCYPGIDNAILGPNAYVRTTNINALSGHGTVDLWLARADCSDPGAATPSFDNVNIQMTEHADKIAKPGYDYDLDGCPDKQELSNAQGQGGLRDPYNRYDYMNATKDGQNRVDDILAVVAQYFLDDPMGNPDPNSQTDRSALLGSNDWNLGPPNGQQRVDDILAQVKQYFHDC